MDLHLLHQGVSAGRLAGPGSHGGGRGRQPLPRLHGGIAVSSTGYGHPKVVAAVKEAADRFLHICGSDFYYEGMAALCERLAKVAPGRSKKRVFLTNSGTEAVEAAIKLARYATRRTAIIAFRGAFHGRTTGAVTLDLEQGAPARRLRAAAPGCVSRSVRLPLPLSVLCRRARVQPRLHRCHREGALHPAARPQGCRRHLRRADPGRRRLHRAPRRLPAGAPRALRPPRHSAGSGRGPVWRRPHREDVRLRARGRGARHSAHRQGPRLGHADRGDDLQRIDHHLGDGLAWLDLRRQPGLLCRRAGDARPGGRGPDGQRRPHGRAAPGPGRRR